MAAAERGTNGAPALVEVLEAARERGLLGPGPVASHVEHALGFGEVAGGPPEGPALDLGSGGGVPGLVLAAAWPSSAWILLDGRSRSAEFLHEAVARLGLAARVRVLEARAETAARDGTLRGSVRLVVARGVGGPAVTAECGAGFLAVGGRLVVSEPPDSTGSRWPAEPLAALGLSGAQVVQSGGGLRYARLFQGAPCPPQFPRRVGIPAKRPLF
jgi:16S rRNA (guanine527-N7)-methyltransferase